MRTYTQLTRGKRRPPQGQRESERFHVWFRKDVSTLQDCFSSWPQGPESDPPIKEGECVRVLVTRGLTLLVQPGNEESE